MVRTVGICIGASRISLAVIEKSSDQEFPGGLRLIKSDSRTHDGDIINVLRAMIGDIRGIGVHKIAITGRKVRNFINLPSIAEAEAVEIAYCNLKEKYPGCDGIVTAGGETFMLYQLNQCGEIVNVFTGSKCASGTGEFFLQQIKRMNLSVEEAMSIAQADAPYSVAGRCSVFCKSDCTHALNKGAEKGKVVAGLCKMMAVKILELLKKCEFRQFLIIGGVAKNEIMINYIKKECDGDRIIHIAEEASYFEAFGTAVWAIDNGAPDFEGLKNLRIADSRFTFLPAIRNSEDKVVFKSIAKDSARQGDRCIVGLDVGSTTTKAVLIRQEDNAILGSVYLRTNGDPVRASRECYQALYDVAGDRVMIEGLGVTGSGRQIAGLHADTDGIINEISAHATAAVYFDPEVDTIFEIGGQDAKYTYITNRVPTDYAMNEACSAGTGSFLEESAKESMGIDTLEIGDIAYRGDNPPNFNDQCAAFIGSDIKTAIQEGIGREDIVAGLVYSICQNYANRVKGNRVVGRKIFMQGGVCYNKAVPMAMASLIGKDIVVPPEPGLMGAFGVALEVKQKINIGLMAPQQFSLKELKDREVSYGKPFICGGGKEKCDRKCTINIIEIGKNKYPFGGACNKYVNMRKNIDCDWESIDYVRIREHLIFDKYGQRIGKNPGAPKIGIIKSLLVNSLYPLYYTFFSELGLDVVLSDKPDADGLERKGAAFCYPAELSHGFMADLLKKELDYIFLPNVLGMYVKNGIDTSVTCPLVQGEPYYLRSAFKDLAKRSVLSPVLDFSKGFDRMGKEFIKLGRQLGFSRKASIEAYNAAVRRQDECIGEMQAIGRRVLEDLENTPEKIAVVLFGRPYNALTGDVNVGIPAKFASRGITVIPWDFLDFVPAEPFPHMFWAMGQMLMKTANLVEKHPQLYGTFVTNFSCGPDSFVLSYFRDSMGQKPSLTLELDSHSADAGIDTRVEAFLDVVAGFIELKKQAAATSTSEAKPKLISKLVGGQPEVIDSQGKKYDIRDKNVIIRIPTMGNLMGRMLAAAMRLIGLNATPLDPPTEADLAVGRAYSSCKECLPYILVAGSILNDVPKHDPNKLLVYFFADSSGPCRFGQYHIQLRNLLRKSNLHHVAVLPFTSDDGYSGLNLRFQIRAWQAVVLMEILGDIYGALLVLAQDRAAAVEAYEQCVQRIEDAIASESWSGLKKVLRREADFLASIPLKAPLNSATKVALLGEIYVRSDSISRQYIVERLADKGIIAKVAPISEFVYYCDYILQKDIYHVKASWSDRILFSLIYYFKQHFEKQIKGIFRGSGLYNGHMLNVPRIARATEKVIDPKFTAGDTVLTIGSALTEIIDEVAGVIMIGPFGCMPSRVAEAILTETISSEKTRVADDRDVVRHVMERYPALPFLSIESDGNSFPQMIEAKLEIFCVQVDRVHKTIIEKKGNCKEA